MEASSFGIRTITAHARQGVQKGGWTLLDQALFAGSNFLLNIFLARWLSEASYGAFAVAFTVFLLVGTVHTGLLTEPMLVFGASRYQGRVRSYLRVLLQGHVVFSGIVGLGLLLVGFGFLKWGNAELGAALLALAVTQPLILFLWKMRRACYVNVQPRLAAIGGMLYAVLMLTGVWGLHATARLSPATALLLMAGAGLLPGFWMLRQLGVRSWRRASNAFRQDVTVQHWTYGRWASATGLVQWLPGHVAFLLLPVWAGLEASGVLKALMNVMMPAMQVYAALSILLLPLFVRAHQSGHLYRFALLVMGMVTLGNVAYVAGIGIWGGTLMNWLYDGNYDAYGSLLWVAGGIPISSGVGAMLGVALKAQERPDRVFWAYLGSTGCALSVSLVLMYLYGVPGALVGNILALLVSSALMVYFFVHPAPDPVPKTGVTSEVPGAPHPVPEP